MRELITAPAPSPVQYVTYDFMRALEQVEAFASTTTSYSVPYSIDYVLVDTTSGAVTITLPLARNGQHFTIIRTAGANNVTVVPSGTDTVNGGASVVISSSYAPATFKAFTPLVTGYIQIA